MTQYIYKNNSLGEEQCNKLIYYFENSPNKFKKNPSNYEGVITNLEEHNFLSNILIREISNYVSIHPFLEKIYSPWTIDQQFHIQKYLPGECYSGEHMEHGKEYPYCLRLLSWMIYLNTIKDSGGTKWPQQNFVTNPIQGDLYIWPAGWTHSHYGIASSEIKYIVTGWCSFVSG
jgi:hypothetical protein